MAAVHLSQPHTQVVVIGEGDLAEQLWRVAVTPFSATKAVLKLAFNKAVAQNLPPALTQTIAQLPAVAAEQTAAVICSGFTCQAPISDAEELAKALRLAGG
jgi:uncharacterized protein YyaL (SSP411 family)